MQKQTWTWTTARLDEPARLARWGHFGTPVLIFPSAGGDFEEIERFRLIGALGALIDQGRIKVYSVDGLIVRAWLSARPSTRDSTQLLENSDPLIDDVLRLVREDCKDPKIEPILAGTSRGAAIAVATLCRHPDTFRSAIGVSGIYDWDCGADPSARSADPPPLGWLGNLTGPQLERLRNRPVVLASGDGDYERPGDSQRLANVLTAKGVRCRFSLLQTRDHTWSTWCDVLPRLLADPL